METHRVSYSPPSDASILKAFPTILFVLKTVDRRLTRAMKIAASAVADAVAVVPDAVAVHSALLTAIAVPQTAVAVGQKREGVFYLLGPLLRGVHPAGYLHDLHDSLLTYGVSPLFQRLLG